MTFQRLDLPAGYKARHIDQAGVRELVGLYNMTDDLVSRIWVTLNRMAWASKYFARNHPEESEADAYAELVAMWEAVF